jgi:ribosome-associated heat shock protein Hsp15
MRETMSVPTIVPSLKMVGTARRARLCPPYADGCHPSMERQRLDKWLWHARVVRARASAAALIEAGHVRVNGVREKAPGHSVKAGDVVTVGLDRTVRILKVTGFAERRGDASAAVLLYDDLQAKRE